jgi:hypothetical protein
MIETRSTTDSSQCELDTEHESNWNVAYQQFLQAVAPRQRDQVARLAKTMHNGGSGLRDWLSAITWRGAILPRRIPEQIIDVYLRDSEAAPLHDCEGCGLAIPVRPSRLHGLEGEPDQIYFDKCPACGSQTGLYLYFSRRFQDNVTAELRRRPR